MGRAFWIDQQFDRDRDGRYAVHVRKNLDAFDWGDIAPVRFACAAWELATPPSLSPGYVRWDRRVLEATCVRNTWDGSLTARVRLVSPLPAQLTSSRAWWRDRGWLGWQEMFGQYVEPSQQDLARHPFLRAGLLVEAPVPLDDLPPEPEGPHDEVEQSAVRAVTVLTRELNALLAPVLEQLGP
ncbi:hypothetical protein OUY22_29850 [Nonomuraea sp. MCN248]|uniref:Uncharacterized protein n=1 Tax=Nonomuraea corallina TaxID=2989783 RepID=A0ABT4SK71_9ACTN|nr:hypothetical protein [Nonomuraea corallina]MDA0637632.1 hypothetical protein [Nonomuraea corallina]